MEKLSAIVLIAFRNLFASRLKTAIVGGIICAGAWLVVLGSSIIDSVSEGMRKSIVGSAAGDIQIYSAKSKDELAIFGGGLGDPDLAEIDDFTKLKAALEKDPNVKSVVPMGISGALVTSGNTIDLALAALRDAVRKMKAGDTSAAVKESYDAEKAHVKHIVQILQEDRKNAKALVDEKAQDPENAITLARAGSPEFWATFDADPYEHLEFLENKIASQAADADMLYLRYMGTDFDDFTASFDRLQIVHGTRVPEGKHGFMFANYFYEYFLKLKTAHRLDLMKDKIDDGHLLIATDPDLQRYVKMNTTQTREMTLQLDDIKAKKMTDMLQKELGSTEANLDALLATYLNTTDDNFHARYDFFYKNMAPLLELYRIRVGDMLTIKAYTKSGYVKSVSLPVYGTFEFKGLEKAALSGQINLMDLSSFRTLYGFMTPEALKELSELKKKAGTTEIARDKAEDELFGSAHAISAEATPGLINEDKEFAEGSAAKQLRDKELSDRVFTKEQMETGTVLNAAVFLKDNGKLAMRTAMKNLEALAKEGGYEVHAVSWSDSSGMIGKLVVVISAALWIIVLIIFSVALVIISNAMVMATLERTQEIGTMRAIGAQRPFLMSMLFVEALVTGLVFGSMGVLLGILTVKAIDIRGIHAWSDVMYFFFSGSRLFPFINPISVAVAFVIVLFVSGVSSFYPAWLAMRVSPRVAMQSGEE